MIDRRGQLWLQHDRALLVLSTRPSTVSGASPDRASDLTPVPGFAQHECVDLTEGCHRTVRENQRMPWEDRASTSRIL